MKKLIPLLLSALLCILPGCAAAVGFDTVAPEAKEPVPANITIHADVDFTIPERAWFTYAANVWHYQTAGLATIKVEYDLDFTSVSNLKEHQDAGDNLMMRADSSMSMVRDMDAQCPQGTPCILAWVSPGGGIHNPWHKPVNSVFIPDRYRDNDHYAELVVLHEMGHMLGLPHLGAVQSIMYPTIVSERTACLKQADLTSFCEVNVCGAVKLHPCE